MKHRSWSRCLIVISNFCCITIFGLVPTFVPRSQSVNVAREMVGWQELINLPAATTYYNAFTITPEYLHSFRPHELAQCLFGDDAVTTLCNDNFIHISGSHVPERSETDWLADYFGLPPDFESSIFLKPIIKNFLVDFNFYQGLDPLLCGLYFKIHAPFVHTHWNLSAYELVSNRGIEGYDAGYFSDFDVPRNQLLNNATEFLSGLKSLSFNDVATPSSQCNRSIRIAPLECSKLPSDGCHCKTLTRTGLSDIEFALGWNFIRNVDYLVGLSIRGSAPTGNTPSDQFFFSPIIGDGRHWKVGIALNGQVILWRNACEDASVGVFLDARAQHLFSSCQQRCFDLCAKPNSRYMLAQRLGNHRLPIHITGEADSGFEFQNEFVPVANLTSTNVDVEIRVEGDSALKIAYMGPHWSFDFGYNYWGRSCERICRRIRNNTHPYPLDDNVWALKGDAHIIGFINGGTTTCVSLSAVEPNADIHGGTNNFPSGINEIRPSANPGIVNPIELTAGNAGNQIDDQRSAVTGIPTRSSNPIVFLTPLHVNFSGTKGLSEKLFFHASYYWDRCETQAAFLGIGGEFEIAHKSDEGCSTKCPSATSVPTIGCSKTLGNNCQRCSLSQWGIWVKGGMAFN